MKNSRIPIGQFLANNKNIKRILNIKKKLKIIKIY